ncbi:MAG: lipopolysaccharide heptosyltransferase II [Candidatus Omnitrophica bacterium]|nr:lipopolysaccharide heptosyltransferase II [Candidatus Omnitrophota bacterium]
MDRQNFPQRILVFNVNWIGDVLFSTACFRTLRYNYPQSFIACIVPPRCKQVLECNPNIDEIIVFDEDKEHKGVIGKLRFVSYLRKKHFDTCFLLHRSFTRKLLVFLAGIPNRIGYYSKKGGFLLTQRFVAPDILTTHRIDYYLNLFHKAGLTIIDRFLEFNCKDEDIKQTEEFLKKQGLGEEDLIVTIHPGGNWQPKRWPIGYYAELADRIIKTYKAKIIITGSNTELPLAEEIAQKMASSPIIASGKLSLKQFGVLTRVSTLFISADSGPLHIANACGCPRIIALFGPTDPSLTGPYPLDRVVILQKKIGCSLPCYNLSCKDYRCMKAITVDQVWQTVQKLLAKC